MPTDDALCLWHPRDPPSKDGPPTKVSSTCPTSPQPTCSTRLTGARPPQSRLRANLTSRCPPHHDRPSQITRGQARAARSEADRLQAGRSAVLFRLWRPDTIRRNSTRLRSEVEDNWQDPRGDFRVRPHRWLPPRPTVRIVALQIDTARPPAYPPAATQPTPAVRASSPSGPAPVSLLRAIRRCVCLVAIDHGVPRPTADPSRRVEISLAVPNEAGPEISSGCRN
jgi:hypothetical protein